MDLEEYRLPETFQWKSKIAQKKDPISNLKHLFLKGPIPLLWLQRAMGIQGSALSVGIILWFFRGLKKSTTFKIGVRDIANYIGCSWITVQRGIKTLEKNGLITLERHKGRKHIVQIQEV